MLCSWLVVLNTFHLSPRSHSSIFLHLALCLSSLALPFQCSCPRGHTSRRCRGWEGEISGYFFPWLPYHKIPLLKSTAACHLALSIPPPVQIPGTAISLSSSVLVLGYWTLLLFPNPAHTSVISPYWSVPSASYQNLNWYIALRYNRGPGGFNCSGRWFISSLNY